MIIGRLITMCWRCNTSYTYEAEACPKCAAINANYDLKAAYKEMSAAGVTTRAHHTRVEEIAKTPNVK